MFVGHTQHAAGPGGGIVKRPHNTGLGQGVVVLNEKKIHHEPDGVAWGEMFSGGFIGKLGEFADEFLEHRAHLIVADGGGVEINVGKLFGNEIQQAGLGKFINLGVKLETFKNVPHGGRERLEIRAQIFADVILIAHELF
jgi:hypothetical protein